MHRDVSAMVHHGPGLIKSERDLKTQRLSAFDPFNSHALGAPYAVTLPATRFITRQAQASKRKE